MKSFVALPLLWLLATGAHGRSQPLIELRVVTLEAPPFVMVGDDGEYSGYLIELWEAVVDRMYAHSPSDIRYEYDLEQVADGRYGSLDPATNEWSGLVGELVKKGPVPTVALAPLTVTDRRMDVIQFTAPYMSAGLLAIARKPSPGAKVPYRHLLDIASCPQSKVVIIGGGATHAMYRNATGEVDRAIHGKIEAHSDVSLATGVNDGVEKLRGGEVTAAIFETPMSQFLVGKEPCDLIEIGSPFGSSQYAIGLGKHSDEAAYRLKAVIDEALLRVKMDGTDERLRAKWWDGDCPKPRLCMCDDDVSGARVSSEEADGEPEPEAEQEAEAGAEPETEPKPEADDVFAW